MKTQQSIVTILVLLVLMATGCTLNKPSMTPTPTGIPSMPNPASVYCQEQGYKAEIRTAEDGSQYGVCIFPNGGECDEWAFFRHECAPAVRVTTADTPTPQTSLP